MGNFYRYLIYKLLLSKVCFIDVTMDWKCSWDGWSDKLKDIQKNWWRNVMEETVVDDGDRVGDK